MAINNKFFLSKEEFVNVKNNQIVRVVSPKKKRGTQYVVDIVAKDSNIRMTVPVDYLRRKNIQERRKERNMTQEQLANKAGVKLSTLQKIERYDTLPLGTTVEVGMKLARALDTQLDKLIRIEEE